MTDRRVVVVPADLIDLVDLWRRRAGGRVDGARAEALRECAADLEDLLREDDD